MPRENFRDWLSKLTIDGRIKILKEKTEKLVDHLQFLLAIQESNRILVFSDLISKQIPQSLAINTFNMLQRSQYDYQLVRLCALWDKADINRESIPTVAALLDDAAVKRKLFAETEEHWSGQTADLSAFNMYQDEATRRAIESAITAHELEFGRQQAEHAKRQIAICIKSSDRVSRCGRFNAVLDHRNRYLAHSLDENYRKMSVSNVRYKDAAWLTDISARIVQLLYNCVCGTGFDVKDARHNDAESARLFWHGVKMSVSN
ncbi:MAG: hypothetical protein K2P80_09770 [Beijerinckiaceae bacterium]|nr:hypothetical protein [Beijerinckiaceae bacterium]